MSPLVIRVHTAKATVAVDSSRLCSGGSVEVMDGGGLKGKYNLWSLESGFIFESHSRWQSMGNWDVIPGLLVCTGRVVPTIAILS